MATQCFNTTLTTHAVPQRVTAITRPAQAALTGSLSGSVSTRGCYISVQAPHTNTAGKYIYLGGAALNVATKTGIGWEILTGAAPIQIFLTNGTTDLADYWFDTDALTDGTEGLNIAVIG